MRARLLGLGILIWLSLPALAAAPDILFLAVELNGRDTGFVVPVLRQEGDLMLLEADVARLGLRHEGDGVAAAGGRYLALSGVPGLVPTLDMTRAALGLSCPVQCFRERRFDLGGTAAELPDRSGPGFFLNYDLVAEADGKGFSPRGLLDAVLFGQTGTGEAGLLASHGPEGTRVVRLDTSWTKDDPRSRQRLRLGDAITHPGSWGRPIRFAGAQFGSDFSLQPSFVPYPVPDLAGATSTPATVDLYIDNVRRLRTEVPEGPFTLTGLPLLRGQGEAQLVIEDLLGREQILVLPYYVTPKLLKPGLASFSLEAGIGREDYGEKSFAYAEPFASGSYGRGLGPGLTGEIHAEVSTHRGAAGATLTTLVEPIGVFELSLAASQDGMAPGGLARFVFERQSGAWSIGLESVFMSSDFTQLGLDEDREPPRRQQTAHLGFSLGMLGQFNLGFTEVIERDGSDIRAIMAGHTIRLGRVTVGLNAFQTLDDDPASAVELSLSLLLGPAGQALASVRDSDGSREAQAELRRNAPSEGGFGYRLLAAAGTWERTLAGLEYEGRSGRVGVEAERAAGEGALRLESSGAVTMMAGHAFLSRTIEDSFAVVELPGWSGVEVSRENRPFGRTDADGFILVPDLVAYGRNKLAIKPEDLPLDVALSTAERSVVPAARSGVHVLFPVTSQRTGIVQLLQADGAPVPAGAGVTLGRGGERFPVGSDGRAFIVGLEPELALEAVWAGGRCAVRLPASLPSGPQPVIGPLACRAEPG